MSVTLSATKDSIGAKNLVLGISELIYIESREKHTWNKTLRKCLPFFSLFLVIGETSSFETVNFF